MAVQHTVESVETQESAELHTFDDDSAGDP
jgi:hypothetical protein